jgi:Flp pilus assembly protein TadB
VTHQKITSDSPSCGISLGKSKHDLQKVQVLLSCLFFLLLLLLVVVVVLVLLVVLVLVIVLVFLLVAVAVAVAVVVVVCPWVIPDLVCG